MKIKMSKSIGNVVDPELILEKYGIDATRYYFLSVGPQNHDISFNESKINQVYYKDIPDSLSKF